MKPAPFDYVAPTSIEEALQALADDEREVKVLAGGQSLIPVMNLRMGHPEVLVDVCRIPELAQLGCADDGALHVGAAVRQATMLTDERVAPWPMLHAAVRNIGHPQIRSRGTVCGSIAHADPAAELPAAALALGATMVARSCRGERRIAADDFFIAPFTTALAEDELLQEVIFPAAPARSGWAFEEVATRSGDFATAGAAAVVVSGEGLTQSARLVLFGVGGTPVRVPAAEAAVTDVPVTAEALLDVRSAVESGVEASDDIHATGRYRVEAAARLAARTIERAWELSHV